MIRVTYSVFCDSGISYGLSFDEALSLCGRLNFLNLNASIADSNGNWIQ